MGCNKAGLTAKVHSKSIKEVVKGSDASVVVSIVHSDSGESEKLTEFLGATGYFAKEDESALTVVGSLSSEDQGRLGFELSSEESALLAVSDAASFQVKAEWGGKTVVFVIEDALPIKDPIF